MAALLFLRPLPPHNFTISIPHLFKASVLQYSWFGFDWPKACNYNNITLGTLAKRGTNHCLITPKKIALATYWKRFKGYRPFKCESNWA